MVGAHAQASGANFFDPNDFYVVESPGQYTLVNNSNDWYIFEFWVTNPFAGNGGFAQTTQTQWSAGLLCGSFCGSENAFLYSDNLAFTLAEFQYDIGPHSSSSNFTFSGPPASDYTIKIVNQQDVIETITGPAQMPGVPEPAAWALIIAGFGAAGAALRRRRAQAQASLV